MSPVVPCSEPTQRIVIPHGSPLTSVLSLVVLDGPRPDERFRVPFDRRTYVIGRGELADILIDDETVSRSHATISAEGLDERSRVVRVIDLKSRNGTFVNGTPVECACLFPGDKLQVGRVMLRLELTDEVDEKFHAEARAAGAHGARRSARELAVFERALERLWFAFQPIVSTRERRIVGWEALVRSDQPSLERPDALVRTAEALGQVHTFGRAVRALAHGYAPNLPEGTYLAVNLHPSDLTDDELVDPDAPLSRVASRVILEITEHASIERFEHLERRVATLRELGFRLALDDVGAGYAGLGTVTRFVPDVLKVDRSIVSGLHLSATKTKVVQSLAALCGELSTSMVLEGVESVEEMVAARDLDCDLMQGYFFAMPHEREPITTVNL